MAQDIHELRQILAALKVVAVVGKKAIKNGGSVVADIPLVLQLVQSAAVIKSAVSEAGQAVPEAKDLDQDEINQLMADVLDLVAAIKAA